MSLYRCAECKNGKHLHAWAIALVHGPLDADGTVTESDWEETDSICTDSIECSKHPGAILEMNIDATWCRWWYCVQCRGTGRSRSGRARCSAESPLGGDHEGWRPADEVREPAWPGLGAGHVLDQNLCLYDPSRHPLPRCQICGAVATSDVSKQPCTGKPSNPGMAFMPLEAHR